MRRVVALAIATAVADPAAAQADERNVSIIQVSTSAELQERICAADVNAEHVLVLPAALFVDSEQLICGGEPYKLYRVIEHDDPDDYEYFLDPPFGTTTRLGCDGKAGRTMQMVALNCRPLK